MHQYTLEEYHAAPEREPTYNELKTRLNILEKQNASLRLRIKALSARLDAEYHRGFDAADKSAYVLGYYDGKAGAALDLRSIPARIRRHRLSQIRDTKSRQALINRYEQRGLKY